MLVIVAKLEKITELKTKSNFVFSTKTPVDELVLLQMLDSTGNLVFINDDVKDRVEAAMKDRSIGIDEQGRSPSQRLRGAIFKAWEGGNLPYETAEDAYVTLMEKFINHYKEL